MKKTGSRSPCRRTYTEKALIIRTGVGRVAHRSRDALLASMAAGETTDGGVLVPSALDILALTALVFVGTAFVRALARRFTQPATLTGGQKKRLPKAQ